MELERVMIDEVRASVDRSSLRHHEPSTSTALSPMACTRQTTRKLIGGKALRKQLVAKSAAAREQPMVRVF
jgi:hypothetical protein